MPHTDEENLDGMTTNERLFVRGLLPKFNEARNVGDVKAMKEILESVEVDQASIDLIISKTVI